MATKAVILEKVQCGSNVDWVLDVPLDKIVLELLLLLAMEFAG